MTKAQSASARDIAHLLHPYTNPRAHESQGPFIVTAGKGVTVTDADGKEYIESLAGLWCCSLGYGEEALIEAATAQMRKLSTYHSFSHRSSEPAIALAEKLIEIAPAPMAKAFFANSGSEANDSLVKIVWYYNNALGRPKKKKIISRHLAYHGVTVASASLTGIPANHAAFDLPIPGILHTDCPHYWRAAEAGETEEAFATRMAENLDRMIVAEGPDTVAAFIAEPVMGAGGVIVPPATYFEKVQAVLAKHDVLFLVDEVICGFGRTGNLFACETYDLRPDAMTLAKQLSSAYVPISAVLISDEMYQAVAGEGERQGTFAHGFTSSGHPVASAVALRTLELMDERDIVGHVRAVAPRFAERVHAFAAHPMVGETAAVGLMAGIEYVTDKETRTSFAPAGRVAAEVSKRAEGHGLISRPLGERSVFAPPLIITGAEIDALFDRYAAAVDETWAWVQAGGLDENGADR
jgi:4-aminobutyrate--pyruvate transaminase